MKPKHQRLVLLGLAIAAVLAAVLLAMSALGDRAAYFYAPSDIARAHIPTDRTVRIGGMVRHDSLRHHPDGLTVDFLVGDDSTQVIQVRYTGILPDLFKEDSGVVAEGRFGRDGRFIASEILAKHDENYRPPVLAGDRHKAETLK